MRESLSYNMCKQSFITSQGNRISPIHLSVHSKKLFLSKQRTCHVFIQAIPCNTTESVAYGERHTLKKISGTKTAPFGHCLTVRKTGPLGPHFGVTFQRALFSLFTKGSRFPKWCSKGAVLVPFFFHNMGSVSSLGCFRS